MKAGLEAARCKEVRSLLPAVGEEGKRGRDGVDECSVLFAVSRGDAELGVDPLARRIRILEENVAFTRHEHLGGRYVRGGMDALRADHRDFSLWKQARQLAQQIFELRACLELHDLALSKLAAGRLKDNELIAALIHDRLVDVETVRARIAAVADLHMRAILLARLQIVLENVD